MKRGLRGVLRPALLLAALGVAAAAHAHRLSPAYFGFVETAPGIFDVQWKVSISGGLAAALEPKVPDGCSLDRRSAHLRRRATCGFSTAR